MSGPATTPCAPISASTGAPAAAAASADITTTAQAPSEICEAEPAVIVPSAANAGRSLASASAVVSARTPSSVSKISGSPRRCGTGTGTISSASRPFLIASAASWCDRAANSSCSARVMPSLRVVPLGRLAHREVVERVGQAVVGHRVDQLGRSRT